MAARKSAGDGTANNQTTAKPAVQPDKTEGTSQAAAATDCRTALAAEARDAGSQIRKHLNELAPSAHTSWGGRARAWARQVWTGQRNPVRVKNLEKVLAHLQVLQQFLARPAFTLDQESCDILTGLLAQLKTQPERISFNNAWELADLLEGELLRLGDTTYIKGIWLTWPPNRVPDYLKEQLAALEQPLTDKRNVEGLLRPFLEEDHRDLVHAYRRDRAMITLRRSYLNIMALTLLVLDLAFCWFFVRFQPSPALRVTGATAAVPATWSGLLMILTVGAIGSVLARATRLSRQLLPSEVSTSKAEELPLGIRSLMSAWSVFWAQVMLGGTAALIVYLIFSSGLLNIADLDVQSASTLAVLSFIAGFSEPFFLDVVGKISGRVV